MKAKAVVLGANYYIGLSIIRCLGIKGIEVVAFDYSEDGAYGLKSKYLSSYIIAPHYKNDPEGFLQSLIDYAKDQDTKPVLFPSADPYVEFIDKHFTILKEYYLFSQTEKGLSTKAMNKDSLALLAKTHNMKIPETILPADKDFDNIINNVIKFPCLVKPTDSVSFVAKFRKKLFQANNMTELKDYIKKAHDENLEVIVQRLIPGFDDHMYTYDAYLNQQSKVTHQMTAQKYRQYPINYGASVYTTQKYVPALFTIGKKFLEDINWKGFAEIEFKKDSLTGEYYLIEINVRTTNFNVLICKTGINMPYIAYQELTGNIEKPKSITKDTGLVFWYAYEDLHAIKGYIKTKQLTVLQVLKSYFKRKAYAIWDINDIKPFLAFFNYKIFKKIKK